MMKKWKLTDLQAESILNLRLRNLRKLEEMELKAEKTDLEKEQAELKEILEDEKKRKKLISKELEEIRKKFGADTELGKRRTIVTEPGEAVIVDIQAFVESEPITVLFSQKGWIRALKGYKDDTEIAEAKYKEGDKARLAIKCKTTDKLLLLGSSGKFYTIGCDKIQTGKGFGEPVSLLVDLAQGEEMIDLIAHKPGDKLIIASTIAKGFIVNSDDLVAQTKGGKAVLNVGKGKALCVRKADGDHIAVVGTNRKLLVFPLEEMPEMKKGAGVVLQKYREAKISDVKVIKLEEGLSWAQGKDGSRTRTETDLTSWIGKRAQAGRLAPQGFPKNNKF